MSPSENGIVNWGILGCALVARNVALPGIRNSQNSRALAIASRDLTKARKFGQDFAIERAYGSYDQLLDDPDIQAVYIPLINSLHSEWTIRAAEKGKHVLCEKPLALNASQAQEMVDASERHGVLLMEVFAHRFHPQNVKAKALIEESRIGRVVSMTSVHSSGRPLTTDIRLSKEVGGGVLMDKGCYCVNTARFITGSEPESVFARVAFGKTGVDERVIAHLKFPDGALCYLYSSIHLAPGTYQQGYEVFGEKGSIRVPEPFSQLSTYREGKIVDTSIFITDHNRNVPQIEQIHFKGVHQWQLQIEHFADQVLQGNPGLSDGRDGLANMKVMDAIYESARQGREVSR